MIDFDARYKEQAYVDHIADIVMLHASAGGLHARTDDAPISDLATILLEQCLKYAGVPAEKENINLLVVEERKAREFANNAKGMFTTKAETEMTYRSILRDNINNVIKEMKEDQRTA